MRVKNLNHLEQISWLIRMIKKLSSKTDLLPTSFTAESVPFADANGVLTDDPTFFKFDGTSLIVGEQANIDAIAAVPTNYYQFFPGITLSGVNGVSWLVEWGAQYTNVTGDSNGPFLAGYKGRGTPTALTASLTGDNLMTSGGYSYRGSDSEWSISGSISIVQERLDGTRALGEVVFTYPASGELANNFALSGAYYKFRRDEVLWTQYGSGNKKASDLSVTRSIYLSGYATDGTIIEVEMGGDYADDTAAGVGGVLSNELFFNTTTGKLTVKV